MSILRGDINKWEKEIVSLNAKIEKLQAENSNLGLTTIASLNAEIKKILDSASNKGYFIRLK